MIETVLLVLLGFFAAAFLALLAMPVLWRRAVLLTGRRIRASMPLSINELEADKDRLRAGHAMAVRRFEMSLQAVNRKAAGQMAEIERLGAEVLELRAARAAQDKAIAALKADAADLKTRLEKAGGTIDDLSRRLEAAVDDLEARGAAYGRLEAMHQEERLAASSRQIELAARESEIRKLEDELGALRQRRKEATLGLRQAIAARKEAEAALKVQEKRNAGLQRQLEAQMTLVSDREEKLERREGEIARLRERTQAAGAAPAGGEEARRHRALEEERDRLRTELADKSLQLRSLLAADASASGAKEDGFAAEREKLQSRLARLVSENRKLRHEGPAAVASRPDGGGAVPADEALREEIGSLAAEMVRLTAAVEGAGSPIDEALSAPAPAGPQERPLSLAERVRALRQTASGTRDRA